MALIRSERSCGNLNQYVLLLGGGFLNISFHTHDGVIVLVRVYKSFRFNLLQNVLQAKGKLALMSIHCNEN